MVGISNALSNGTNRMLSRKKLGIGLVNQIETDTLVHLWRATFAFQTSTNIQEPSMTYADSILPEFDQEMATTRRVLERIPADKFDWKAHPKSNTIGWNVSHLAEIPSWVEGTLTQDSWEMEPEGGQPYRTPILTTPQEVLEAFDRNVAAARAALAKAKDEDMPKMWSLLQKGEPLFSMPRAVVIRTFVMNHMVHHRAIVCVYLRLNDIPVPSVYGPSGDE
jgi:uncharacterized damage-inducible protein DinB